MRTLSDIGRNDPCPCGSGKKHKRCCMEIAAYARPTALPVTEILHSAFQHHRAGRLQEAEEGYRRILQLQPNHPEALLNLGMLAQQAGRCELALALMKRAVDANPASAICHKKLGNLLLEQGKVIEAVAYCTRAIALKPDYAEAHNNLGVVLKLLGKLDEARACFRQALSQRPNYPEAHSNLGLTLCALGQLDDGAASCTRALALKPDYAVAYNNLGLALKLQGKLDDAAASCTKAIALKPDYTEAHYNLAVVLKLQGKLDEAAASYARAIALKPDYAEAHNDLGATLCALGRLEEAAASCTRALALRPDYPEAHNNLSIALIKVGKLDEAIASLTKALALKPDYAEAYNNLGIALKVLGRLDEAADSYNKAIALKPDFALAYSNLLFMHAFMRDVPPESQVALAADWEKAVLSESDRNAAYARRFSFQSRTGRKLRLGIVSAELGQHAVAEFLEPVLEQLDRDRLHVTLFPTVLRSENRVARFQELANQWEPLAGIAYAEAAARIRSEQIDILIDTTGHMSGCALGIFAHRAAPVQCHYIGQCGTTGLAEMDWFIACEDLLPASCNAHFSERIWRLPRLWVAYRGDQSLPESRWEPDERGIVWLGSFNTFEKIREDACRLWAKVMNALPESKLLLKDWTTRSDLVQQRILCELARHGIESGRVEFAGSAPDWKAHMSMYDRLDIALDPIPLNSGTTAFDALWMGVPLVSLQGDWMGGRMSSTILRALGKREWVVHSEAEYVSTVAALARDVEGRRALRAQQRSLMAGSSLCDAKALARALEDAFEGMLEDWAARLTCTRKAPYTPLP